MYDDSMENTQGILSSNSFLIGFYMVSKPRVQILGKLGRNFTKKKEGCGGVLLKHPSRGRVG